MSFITIAFLLVIFVLIIAFVVRSKIVSALAAGLRLSFPILVIVSLAALFWPLPYKALAEFTLRNGGTLEYIQQFDTQLEPIMSIPESLFGGISDLFAGNDHDGEDESQIGFLEEKLFPGLASAVSGILRVTALILSILGMAAITYLSYPLQGAFEVEKLKHRIKELEDRLVALETPSTV